MLDARYKIPAASSLGLLTSYVLHLKSSILCPTSKVQCPESFICISFADQIYCMTDHSLFLKNLWYLAFHGSSLKQGKLVGKEMLGEKIVFGRDKNGTPFALRDNCAHRGVPLSQGWFKNDTIQCCYHGWEFGTDGVCKNIPALPLGGTVDISKIKVFQYPCKEISGKIWVYIQDNKLPNVEPKMPPPE